MSQPDEKFRKVVKSTSEEKTTSSESTESRDTATGRFEKRIVESETYERRTKHSEIYESGPIRTEKESTHTETSPSVSAAIPSMPHAGWSGSVPRRLKLLLRGARPALTAESPTHPNWTGTSFSTWHCVTTGSASGT